MRIAKNELEATVWSQRGRKSGRVHQTAIIASGMTLAKGAGTSNLVCVDDSLPKKMQTD